MQTVLAAIGIIIAWLTYRLGNNEERNKTLNSIEALLKSSGKWLGTNYPESLNDKIWLHPGKLVYKIDTTGIGNMILNKSISRELACQLTFFSQRATAFNQLIERFSSYIDSDIELKRKSYEFHKANFENCVNYEEMYKKLESIKQSEKELFFYIRHFYKLQKSIHTDGIGSEGYYNDEYPTLRQCFINIKNLHRKESCCYFNILCWNKYFLGDLTILAILGLIIGNILAFGFQ